MQTPRSVRALVPFLTVALGASTLGAGGAGLLGQQAEPAVSSRAPSAERAAPASPELEAPPCVREESDRPIHEFTSYRELGVELRRIQSVSDGRVSVERIGESNRGRVLRSATVGDGDKVVLVTSEIHGDEKTGTDALLRILDYLGTSESRQAERIRDELTLVAVPKFNVDGAELDRRGNDRSWDEVVADFPQLAGSEPAWNYIDTEQSNDDYSQRPGFDVNRDFHADLGYQPRPEDFPGGEEQFGWYILPEAQVLRDLYVDLADEYGSVDVYVDLHHQGACVAQEGSLDLLDVGVDYPPLPDEHFEPGGKYAGYANAYRRDYSLQLATSAFNGMEREGFIPARYPHPAERDVPGQARSAFALNGTGTVLFEVRGQTETLGQEGRERFTQAVVAGLGALIKDVSTGAVHRIDPESFFTLPATVDLEGDGGSAAAREAAGVGPSSGRAEVQRNLD